MDGTLVDTEPYWIEVEFALVAEFGGTWSMEHALNLVGNDLLVTGEYLREHGGVDLPATEIVDRLLDGVIARINERVPVINVHFDALSNHDRFDIIGEAPVGPIGPAIGNAIFQATGKRLRSTPFRNHDLSWS